TNNNDSLSLHDALPIYVTEENKKYLYICHMEQPAVLERFDVDRIRQDFPILTRTVNNKPLVYLDNGATTQKPRQVIDAIVENYRSEEHTSELQSRENLV